MTPATDQRSVFDSIAVLLPHEHRPQFYRLMAHCRELQPEDEILRIIEAMGFLALLVREAPGAIVEERLKLEAVLRDAGFTPGVFQERARELGDACAGFGRAVQELTDPNTGAPQRIAKSLMLMQGEVENACRHMHVMSTTLRLEFRRAIGLIVLASVAAGFVVGWFLHGANIGRWLH